VREAAAGELPEVCLVFARFPSLRPIHATICQAKAADWRVTLTNIGLED